MTDNNMRHIFIGYQVQVLDADPEEANAEFSRWLAAHDAEIREQAAQQIEKVLSFYTTHPIRLALHAAAEIVRGM